MFDNFFREVKSFYIVIYARLSKEESNKSKSEQSKSIKNQIEICKRYIEEEKAHFSNCSYEIVATLKDDGISGTTFERDDFKELIKLIEDKKVNMVITTDLSRLGRNHLMTDNYIEEWFPSRNVRYVSIVESIDTYTDCMNNDIAPIINWSNEHFAKLTSKKIKSRFSLLRTNGLWTGGEVPLGYKLDKQNKYHFVEDEVGAELVRKIFKLFLEHKSCSKVRTILTKENIPLPSLIKGTKRNIDEKTKDIWSIDTIKKILTNEMYLGHMVQGKSTRLNHKSKKKIYLPKTDWVIVKNTHKPLIDEDTFFLVQSYLKTNKNKSKRCYDYLLKGLLKCKECNRSIGVQHYKDRKKNYTTCNYYRKYGQFKDVCTAHRFVYEEIESQVLKSIKETCLQFINEEKILQELIKQNSNKNTIMENKVNKIKKEIEILKREIDTIYEDKINGLIDVEQYKRISRPKKEKLQYTEELLKDSTENSINNDKDLEYYKHILTEFSNNPPRAFLTALIDKIYLSENGEIDVYLNIKHPNKKFKK